MESQYLSSLTSSCDRHLFQNHKILTVIARKGAIAIYSKTTKP
ncbi:hypothetical protein [Calothrix sp. 336/3]